MAAPAPLPAAVGIVAGSGALPFALAEAVQARGARPVLFPIRGFCDPKRAASFPHHWLALGQLGRLTRLLRAEGCCDVVFIGGLVRPALSELRLDWSGLRALPSVVAAFRGGDDHLLSGVSRIIESKGFHVVGVKDVAPDLLMPAGDIAAARPDAAMRDDIAQGRDVLRALGPFDIGQAVVVIDRHVVALEDIEGTDGLLARVARLRADGRIRARPGRGVLVKAPKATQDLRFDLPTFGPRTVEGAAAAGLAGIAVVAGQALLAEPEATVAAADRAGLFVTGLAE